MVYVLDGRSTIREQLSELRDASGAIGDGGDESDEAGICNKRGESGMRRRMRTLERAAGWQRSYNGWMCRRVT